MKLRHMPEATLRKVDPESLEGKKCKVCDTPLKPGGYYIIKGDYYCISGLHFKKYKKFKK